MKTVTFPLAALVIASLLAACGAEDLGTRPLNRSFGGIPDCSLQPGNESCTTPGGGTNSNTSSNAVITTDNYINIATALTLQLDYLGRQRNGAPKPLTDLALAMLDEIKNPTGAFCTPSGNMTVTDNGSSFNVDFIDCLVGDSTTNFPLNGSVTVSNITESGIIYDTSSSWSISATFTISSLTYTLSTNDELGFSGAFQLQAGSGASTLERVISLTPTSSNLNIGDSQNGTLDTYNNGLTVTSTTKTSTDEHALSVSGNYQSNVLNGSELAIVTPTTFIWSSGMENPRIGQMTLTDTNSGASSLTLDSVSDNAMSISSSNGDTATTTW